MKWQKHGLIYVPNGKWWWAKSHGYLPTATIVNNECIRVYYTALDENQYGRIGYLDLAIDNPSRIVHMESEPILGLGELGTFDDSGVNASCVINWNDAEYLYYVGWQRSERIPYLLFCGLAIGDGKTFQRYARVPILDRSSQEPYTRSASTVIVENNALRMWYVSALSWITIEEKLYPTYVIRHAKSDDGIHWSSQGDVCIDFMSDDEFGFGRPWVIKDGSLYKIWYSIRSKTQPYRLGYAESADGLTWERKDDKVGLIRSDSGWDSEMICFPCVIDVLGKRYMFYNGNRHGATGFGYAELIEE
jgi:predicted GH43/DUF377 family glycosyl hydrolase